MYKTLLHVFHHTSSLKIVSKIKISFRKMDITNFFKKIVFKQIFEN